jgi:hypothetical protein
MERVDNVGITGDRGAALRGPLNAFERPPVFRAQTRVKITHRLRYRVAAQPILIAHLEETRIRVDVVCPQQLHHRRHLVGPIVFAVREHICELA